MTALGANGERVAISKAWLTQFAGGLFGLGVLLGGGGWATINWAQPPAPALPEQATRMALLEQRVGAIGTELEKLRVGQERMLQLLLERRP